MANVDMLAVMLSKQTGTEFKVHRAPAMFRPQGTHYIVTVTRGEHSWSFEAGNITATTRWLAALGDLINMGFIRVEGVDYSVPAIGYEP